MTFTNLVRTALGLTIAGLLVVVPWVYYRWEYAYSKRLREVDPGRVYRSGQLTADGFADAVARYGIKTVLNLQDEYPDPDVENSFFGAGTVKETELCRRLGVRYVYIQPDMVSKRDAGEKRPTAVDRYLALMDDPATYPVLIHCRAGLHRTGVLVAIYRMEYHGWSAREALDDLKANGFGEFACTSANDYITQYVLNYRPGVRVRAPGERGADAPRGSASGLSVPPGVDAPRSPSALDQ